jgi:hypothetical protein
MLLDGGDVAGPKKNAAAIKAAEVAQAKADAQAAAAQKALEDAKTKADALAAIKAADAAADAQAAAKAQADAAAKAEAAKTAGAKALADKAVADAKAIADKAAATAAAAIKVLPQSTGADAATAARKLSSNQPLTDAEKKLLGISVTPAKAEPVNAGIAPLTGPTWQQVADAKEAEAAAKLAAKPDPTKTAYADLTPAQRDAMSQDEKMDYMEAARKFKIAADAGTRAASNPMFDVTNRPTAPTPKPGKINHYTWIGGVKDGQWRLYEADDTPENRAKYNGRNIGGPTQATYNSAVGANALLNPEASTNIPPANIVPTGKKEVSKKDNGDGTFTITYDDGSTAIIGTKIVNNNVNVVDDPNEPDPVVESDNPLIDPNKPAKTLISTGVDAATGNTIGYFADGSQEVLNEGTGPTQSAEFKDAYALLEATFISYGLESLVPAVKGYMERNIGPEQAKIELRTDPAYIKRFKGNQLRLAAGKNALAENVYLLTEQAYDQTLKSYGQANYFGIDREAKQLKMAEIIGNDINPDEFKSRVDLAVTRVSNADPSIKKLLKDFYPSLTEADLVGYFLNPAENLPKLQERVTAAEIGSAFLGQGLDYTRQQSVELAQYGIDRAGALKGAAEVKEALPQSQKYADIYGESGIKYTQETAEQEFLKNNQDAATKRKRLASMERGSFSGSAGVGQGAFRTTTTGQI